MLELVILSHSDAQAMDISSFFYPINPADPVKVLRSGNGEWIGLLGMMGNQFKFFDNPLVEALAGLCRSSRNLAVKLRGKTKVEFSGIWFVRIYAPLAAVFKIFIDYGMKAFSDFRNGFTMKTNDVPGINDPAHKNAVIEVGFDPGNISLVGKCIHGRLVLRNSTFVKSGMGNLSSSLNDKQQKTARKSCNKNQ